MSPSVSRAVLFVNVIAMALTGLCYAQPEPLGVLAELDKTFHLLGVKSSYTTKTVISHEGGKKSKQPPSLVYESSLLRNDKQLYIQLRTYLNPEVENLDDFRYVGDRLTGVLDDQAYYIAVPDNVEGAVPKGISVSSDTALFYTKLLGGALSYGLFLEGIIDGENTKGVVSLLKASDTLNLHEGHLGSEGEDLLVLSGDTPCGNVEVVIDPDEGYNIRKMTITRTTGHSYNGNILGASTGNSGLREVAGVLDDVKIVQVDGVPVISEATFTESKKYADGSQEKTIAHHIRENINLNPAIDSESFTIEVPNGTPVSFLDERSGSAMKYFWQDGKIEMKFDANELKTISNQVDRMVNPENSTSSNAGVPVESPEHSQQPESGAVLPVMYVAVALIIGAVMFCTAIFLFYFYKSRAKGGGNRDYDAS